MSNIENAVYCPEESDHRLAQIRVARTYARHQYLLGAHAHFFIILRVLGLHFEHGSEKVA